MSTFDEEWTLERVVDVVGGGHRFRIEVMATEAGRFEATVRREERVQLAAGKSADLWVLYVARVSGLTGTFSIEDTLKKAKDALEAKLQGGAA